MPRSSATWQRRSICPSNRRKPMSPRFAAKRATTSNKPPAPPACEFFQRLIARRNRRPHRHRPHPLRSGRNRALPFPARLRDRRTGRHPPGHRRWHRPPAARDRSRRRSSITCASAASPGATTRPMPRRAFARNRIRHELLPQLTRDWNPAMAETLAHTADWAQAEEAYWESELARLAPAHLVFDPPAVLLRVDTSADLPLAAARRVVRRAVEWAKGDLRGIGFEHLVGILESGCCRRRARPPPDPRARCLSLIRLAADRPADGSITWIIAIIGCRYRYLAPSGCPAKRR